jgi:8-oxo-dGTP pyrophosphatase MutT (NUDIX family)
MHRRSLLDLLERYADGYPEELSCVSDLRDFVAQHPDCFERSCEPGHVTASSWIVSHDHRDFLLTHHRKLGRWLQLGGHADGDSDVQQVALREAREESGMEHFECVPDSSGMPLLDLDIHRIPARPGEPAHHHFDVRFLLVAKPDQPLRISHESNDLQWFSQGRVAEFASEESLARLARKAHTRLVSS